VVGWGGHVNSCEGGVIDKLLVGPVCLGDAAGRGRRIGARVAKGV
jgi:hypothetical protein